MLCQTQTFMLATALHTHTQWTRSFLLSYASKVDAVARFFFLHSLLRSASISFDALRINRMHAHRTGPYSFRQLDKLARFARLLVLTDRKLAVFTLDSQTIWLRLSVCVKKACCSVEIWFAFISFTYSFICNVCIWNAESEQWSREQRTHTHEEEREREWDKKNASAINSHVSSHTSHRKWSITRNGNRWKARRSMSIKIANSMKNHNNWVHRITFGRACRLYLIEWPMFGLHSKQLRHKMRANEKLSSSRRRNRRSLN